MLEQALSACRPSRADCRCRQQSRSPIWMTRLFALTNLAVRFQGPNLEHKVGRCALEVAHHRLQRFRRRQRGGLRDLKRTASGQGAQENRESLPFLLRPLFSLAVMSGKPGGSYHPNWGTLVAPIKDIFSEQVSRDTRPCGWRCR